MELVFSGEQTNNVHEDRMKKNIWTMCGGGMGNRVLGSLTAYHFARRFNTNLNLTWGFEGVRNEGCMASWRDLFEDPVGRIQLYEDTVNMEKPPPIYIVHHNFEMFDKFGPDRVFNHRSMSELQVYNLIESITEDCKIIITDNDINRNLVSVENAADFFTNAISPKKEIKENVEKFCDENQITPNSTIGCHFRCTDVRPWTSQAITSYVGTILQKNPNKKVFVCSDEKEVEDCILQKFPQRTIRKPKTQYVEKHNKNYGWIDHSKMVRAGATYEEMHKVFPTGANVRRTEQSVIEGLEDCLILSRTTLAPGGGSFWHLAQHFGAFNKNRGNEE